MYPGKELMSLKNELTECIISTLKSDTSLFQKIKDDPNVSILEITIAKFAQEAAKGSAPHLQFLLDRTIGKPKEEKIDRTEDDTEVIEMIPKEKLLALVTEHYDNKRLLDK